MNEMNREMRRMSEREERLAKKADRNIGKFNNEEKVKPSSDTPALAKAKIGIIPNATYGDRPCSNFKSKEFLLTLVLCGIVEAKRTPAIVA